MHAVMHAQCIVGNFGDIIAMKNVDNRRNLVILYYNIAAEQSSVSVILAGVFGALFAVSLLVITALLLFIFRTRHSWSDSPINSRQLSTSSCDQADQSKRVTDEGQGHYANVVTWNDTSAEYTKPDYFPPENGTQPQYEELRKTDDNNKLIIVN